MQNSITRKPSVRLKEYDYCRSNYYFITASTENQIELFGKIIDDQMLLNDAGIMIQKTLLEIPDFYSTFSLDAYVIMPNHLHAIIIIQNHSGQAQGPGPTYKLSLSDVIGRFKILTTKKYIDSVKNNGWPTFNKKIWQRSFYDHIIRNDKSLQKIREYIINNPATWELDENNIKNYSLKGEAGLASTMAVVK